MKKWKEYTSQEKRMILVLGVLLVLVLLSWGRIERGFHRGQEIFFGTPADTTSNE